MVTTNTQENNGQWGPNECPDPLPETSDGLYDKEIERCVLGSMMAGPDEAIGPIAARVPVDAFYYKEHRILFEAIATVYESGAIDLVLLRDYLKQEGKLDDVNGVAYYVDCIDIMPSAANHEHYTDRLMEYYDRRKIAALVKDVFDADGTPQEQLSQIQEAVDEIDLSTGTTGALTIEPLAQVQDRALVWFWEQKIPDYGMTMVQGDPGVSKSYLTAYMAARISTGRAWPDCPDIPVEQGAVMIFNGEDDPARIKERCRWMGGDMANIHLVTPGKDKPLLDIRTDIKLLQRAIDDMPIKCRLIVFDPITSYMGNCQANNNNEVRAALEPLSNLAVKNRLCIVIINHMNKKQGDKHVYRGLGSMGFTAVCRSVWGIILDENDEDRQTRLFCPVKTNYSESASGLKYRIIENAIEFDREPYYGSIDDVSGQAKDNKESLAQDCAIWLKERIGSSEVASDTIKEQAKEKGFSWNVLQRAKKIVGAKSRKESAFGGQWFMSIPEDENSDG